MLPYAKSEYVNKQLDLQTHLKLVETKFIQIKVMVQRRKKEHSNPWMKVIDPSGFLYTSKPFHNGLGTLITIAPWDEVRCNERIVLSTQNTSKSMLLAFGCLPAFLPSPIRCLVDAATMP